MLLRFIRPLPILMIALLTGTAYYLFDLYIPKTYEKIVTSYPMDTLLEDKKSINNSELFKPLTETIKTTLDDNQQHNHLITFINKFPGLIEAYPFQLEFTTQNQKAQLTLVYEPIFYEADTIDKINSEITTYLGSQSIHHLQEQKTALETKVKESINEIETLKASIKPEVVEEVKPEVKPMIKTSKIPPEVAENIIKFKEFKTQKENQLKEIRQQIEAMSAPSQAPLVMLTSNLQKNYEMQLIILNGKRDWLKNSDKEQLLKIEEEKNKINEKLAYENMRLRDESYYIKGLQDKAMREKYAHLLREEKNLKETLEALNDLQNAIFEQDQNAEDQINIKENLTEKKPIEPKKLSPEEEKIILLTASNNKLQDSIKEMDVKIAILKKNGLKLQESKSETLTINFMNHTKFLMAIGATFLLMYTLIALVFGSSNKISSHKVIANILDAPYLGTIPNLPNEGLENAKHKKLTDAIETITDNLLKSMQSKNVKTLNVLSPETNDGRTQLTGMLCLSFNLKKNMKIIALDACFNNPKLADFLELKNKLQPNDDGLISYIKHLVEAKEISEDDNNQWLAKLVKPCIRNGIFVISPGNGSLSDNYSFNSKVITTMYEGLGKYVDIIISDTPPLNSPLSFVSKVLAENSVGNIVLIKKGIYKKKDIEAIKKKLMGVSVLGFVLK